MNTLLFSSVCLWGCGVSIFYHISGFGPGLHMPLTGLNRLHRKHHPQKCLVGYAYGYYRKETTAGTGNTGQPLPLELATGIEPATSGVQNRCSSN